MNIEKYIDILPEVKEALEMGKPVVALESTIISHGMPYPQNKETAHECEKRVRDNGAVPATICVLNGRIKVGINEEDLEILAQSKNVAKLSRRDLAIIIAEKGNGATTVATTMIIANMAGIRLFATGGIGGVHRGVAETWDISADLEELASTNVCVVCAGVKSILDIPKTLEYLETKGVPVLTMGTKQFPAFFTPNSGCEADYAAESPLDVAKILQAKDDLGLRGGVLVGNPISKDKAMDDAVINKAIDQALSEAEAKGIHGKAVTPFMLGRVVELTGGDSLKSNMALVFSNCEVAAKIAVELHNLQK